MMKCMNALIHSSDSGESNIDDNKEEVAAYKNSNHKDTNGKPGIESNKTISSKKEDVAARENIDGNDNRHSERDESRSNTGSSLAVLATTMPPLLESPSPVPSPSIVSTSSGIIVSTPQKQYRQPSNSGSVNMVPYSVPYHQYHQYHNQFRQFQVPPQHNFGKFLPPPLGRSNSMASQESLFMEAHLRPTPSKSTPPVSISNVSSNGLPRVKKGPPPWALKKSKSPAGSGNNSLSHSIVSKLNYQKIPAPLLKNPIPPSPQAMKGCNEDNSAFQSPVSPMDKSFVLLPPPSSPLPRPPIEIMKTPTDVCVPEVGVHTQPPSGNTQGPKCQSDDDETLTELSPFTSKFVGNRELYPADGNSCDSSASDDLKFVMIEDSPNEEALPVPEIQKQKEAEEAVPHVEDAEEPEFREMSDRDENVQAEDKGYINHNDIVQIKELNTNAQCNTLFSTQEEATPRPKQCHTNRSPRLQVSTSKNIHRISNITPRRYTSRKKRKITPRRSINNSYRDNSASSGRDPNEYMDTCDTSDQFSRAAVDFQCVQSVIPRFSPTDIKSAKRLVAEQFLNLLAIKQYFGRVLKLKNIVIHDENIESLLKRHPVLMQRPNLSSSSFYDEVQMGPGDLPDSRLVGDDYTCVPSEENGLVETPMMMCVLTEDGNRGYVDRDNEVARLFSSTRVNSILVADRQVIVAREGSVTPVASVCVVWRPNSVSSIEHQCPIHKKDMEVYDPASKDLACSLCAATEGRKMLILSDVVSPQIQSEVQSILQIKQKESLVSISKYASSHQKHLRAQQRSLETINDQFDALAAAVERKRNEFIDEVLDQTEDNVRDLSYNIRSLADTLILLEAAMTSLQSHGRALTPPELATLATALKAESTVSSEGADAMVSANCHMQHLPCANLEEVTNKLQELRLNSKPPHSSKKDRYKRGNTDNNNNNDNTEFTITATNKVGVVKGMNGVNRAKFDLSSGYRDGPNSVSRREDKSSRDDKKLQLVANRPGTSLFSFPIHEMLFEKRFSGPVEWCLRIDDPGDWLGIGVGVGGTLDVWANGGIFDLHHLWVVPQRRLISKMLLVRVTFNNSSGGSSRHNVHDSNRHISGHAKLTIHDINGKQIDDGRIPHWHASRNCYPQVSFGGRHGSVTMVTLPA